MAITRYKDIVDCFEQGRSHYTTFRKVPSQVNTIGAWFDLSLSPGNPIPQYYASNPLAAKVMRLSDQGGFYHRGNVAPMEKVLAKSTLISNSANAVGSYILADYLLYYPFIDEGSTDEQILDNTEILTRYKNGAGVQIMAVSVAPRNGNARFQVKYTNQDGVSGRLSGICISTANAANGTLINTGQLDTTTGNRTSPFIPLQGTDTGVRKIESVTMLDPDIGLFALVLVKPIVNTYIADISGPTEVEYFRDSARLPEIQDDAFLSFIANPMGSIAGTVLTGDLTFIFN